MARSWSVTFPSTRWPKRSTPILRQDKGFLPQSKSLIPTWRRGKECLGTTKVLDNFAALVALGVTTIHSPRRCGTLPRPALARGVHLRGFASPSRERDVIKE